MIFAAAAWGLWLIEKGGVGGVLLIGREGFRWLLEPLLLEAFGTLEMSSHLLKDLKSPPLNLNQSILLYDGSSLKLGNL